MDEIYKYIKNNINNEIDYSIIIENIKEEYRKELINIFSDSKFTLNKINDFLYKVNYIIRLKTVYFTINIIDIDINDILLIRIKKVLKRVYLLYKYFDIKKNINIWFIPLNVKRKFPKVGEEVSEENINGGFTFANGNDIYIYRYEEFPKVMLHEVIHHTYIDTNNKWLKSDLLYLKNLLNIDLKSEFSPNESIVETWTTIIHLIFIAIELNISIKNVYENELKWSYMQSKKLLSHKDTLCNYKVCKWSEDTNSFSYVYIKTILLYNIKKLNMKSEIIDIINLIKATINDKEFIKEMNKMEVLDNCRSLRMTLYGDL